MRGVHRIGNSHACLCHATSAQVRRGSVGRDLPACLPHTAHHASPPQRRIEGRQKAWQAAEGEGGLNYCLRHAHCPALFPSPICLRLLLTHHSLCLHQRCHAMPAPTASLRRGRWLSHHPRLFLACLLLLSHHCLLHTCCLPACCLHSKVPCLKFSSTLPPTERGRSCSHKAGAASEQLLLLDSSCPTLPQQQPLNRV